MSEDSKPSPTTDETVADILRANMERQRAMLLSWADELERVLGKKPRTSQIREFWRNHGSPLLDK